MPVRIGAKVRVNERNGGLRRVARQLAELDSVELAVGFPAGASPAGEIMKAAWSEFGTRTQPERPFFRNAMRDNRSKYRDMISGVARRVLAGDMTVTRGLDLVGLAATADIQASIVSLRTPPNAPSTIRKKGSSNPLIDEGLMRQSVRHVIRPRGSGGS